VRGLFVTGTDTGVGKTIVAAAICAALAARGEQVAAFKPVVTGTDDAPGAWPPDHELLAASTSAGQTAADVTPITFKPPVSPHYAAELAGTEVDVDRVLAAAKLAADQADTLVCEGVGGLLVPLTPDYSVRDLAVELALPLIVVARTGLGTINHTLLTVEAARAAGLHVAGIVMTPWPAHPEPIEQSNRATVERLSGVQVSGLPPTTSLQLAAAGAALPLDNWLGPAPSERSMAL
jgi:dethiobiotin synthetase